MKALAIVLLIVLVIIAIPLGGLFSIWMLNTLFGLSIPFTFKTWLAAFWLNAVIAARSYK